jgi:hypothetical protein
MLCFYHKYNKFGEVCTNSCPYRQTCEIKRASFLIEAIDNLATDIELEIINGIHVSFLSPYCTSPEAYLNGAIYDHGATAKNESIMLKS